MRGFTRAAARDRARRRSGRKGWPASITCSGPLQVERNQCDAYFNGRYNGAFTYYYVKVMRESRNQLSRKPLWQRARAHEGEVRAEPAAGGKRHHRSQAIAY